MTTPFELGFDTLSEADLEPVLELLRGGDPGIIAHKFGIRKEKLIKMRDDLLAQAEGEKIAKADVPLANIGRNEPCPCGSGKKYKNCCLDMHAKIKSSVKAAEARDPGNREKEQKKLIDHIEEAFGMFAAGNYADALRRASKLIRRYPNEDRLHDIMVSSHLVTGECDTAIGICRHRLEVANVEKAFFIEHGRYRDTEGGKPALSYYYPPMTWLQKYWIALKTKDYQGLYPETENPEITELVKELQTADDPNRFPAKYSQGHELRKKAVQETLDKLKGIGPEVVPYMLPLACRYSWAGLFVPEILFCCKTDLATRSLIDISMFGYAYASGAGLHYLEKLGERTVPCIEEAFLRNKTFDPIKTGIVSVLGNIRGSAAYELLLRLLEHESAHIVNWAGAALAKFGSSDALPAMMAANERIGGEQMIDAAIQKLMGHGRI